jgi:hypothetical protein
MFSIFFTALKFGIGQAFGFVAEHWRVVLPIVIVGFFAYRYYGEVDRADKAELALFTLQQDNLLALEKRQAENALIQLRAETAVAIAEANAKAQMDKLNLDRQREAKALKEQYETRLNGTTFNWSERVRLEQEREAANGLSDITGNTSGFAEGLRECNRAYTTLERACQITTIDFNTCRVWADTACNTVGCKQGK